jgi:hypothetical protein
MLQRNAHSPDASAQRAFASYYTLERDETELRMIRSSALS